MRVQTQNSKKQVSTICFKKAKLKVNDSFLEKS